MGYSNIIVSTKDFVTTITLNRPPLAVAAVLEGMSVGLDKGIDEGLRVDVEWGGKLAKSKDAAEGITAFLQKREPVFTGE